MDIGNTELCIESKKLRLMLVFYLGIVWLMCTSLEAFPTLVRVTLMCNKFCCTEIQGHSISLMSDMDKISTKLSSTSIYLATLTIPLFYLDRIYCYGLILLTIGWASTDSTLQGEYVWNTLGTQMRADRLK